MNLFISYRREDTTGRAGRLNDALAAAFDPRDVFFDTSSIRPGQRYPPVVERALRRSDFVLVVIGPDWIPQRRRDRRLNDSTDWVHREVAHGLRHHKVIPVLVGGASPPSEDQLPKALRPLAHTQAFHLHDESWQRDVDHLIKDLSNPQQRSASRSSTQQPPSARTVLVVVAILLFIVYGGDRLSMPRCGADDGSWTVLPVATGEAVLGEIRPDSGIVLRYTPVGARVRRDGGGDWAVHVDIDVADDSSAPAAPGGEWHVSHENFQRLVVDGVPSDSAPTCFGPVAEDQSLGPRHRANATIGYRSDVDPTHDLAIEITAAGALPIVSEG